MARKAFTVIELLVVVSIIVTLVALLFPALLAAKASANERVCVSNLRQLAMAVVLYRSEHDPVGHYGSRDEMGLPTKAIFDPRVDKDLWLCRGSRSNGPPGYTQTFFDDSDAWTEHAKKMEERSILFIDLYHRNHSLDPSPYYETYAFAVQIDTTLRKKRARGLHGLKSWEE